MDHAAKFDDAPELMTVRVLESGALTIDPDEFLAHIRRLRESERLLRTILWTLKTNQQHPATCEAIKDYFVNRKPELG